MLISGYTSPWDLLREELNQRKEEGFLIPAELTTAGSGFRYRRYAQEPRWP